MTSVDASTPVSSSAVPLLFEGIEPPVVVFVFDWEADDVMTAIVAAYLHFTKRIKIAAIINLRQIDHWDAHREAKEWSYMFRRSDDDLPQMIDVDMRDCSPAKMASALEKGMRVLHDVESSAGKAQKWIINCANFYFLNALLETDSSLKEIVKTWNLAGYMSANVRWMRKSLGNVSDDIKNKAIIDLLQNTFARAVMFETYFGLPEGKSMFTPEISPLTLSAMCSAKPQSDKSAVNILGDLRKVYDRWNETIVRHILESDDWRQAMELLKKDIEEKPDGSFEMWVEFDEQLNLVDGYFKGDWQPNKIVDLLPYDCVATDRKILQAINDAYRQGLMQGVAADPLSLLVLVLPEFAEMETFQPSDISFGKYNYTVLTDNPESRFFMAKRNDKFDWPKLDAAIAGLLKKAAQTFEGQRLECEFITS